MFNQSQKIYYKKEKLGLKIKLIKEEFNQYAEIIISLRVMITSLKNYEMEIVWKLYLVLSNIELKKYYGYKNNIKSEY